jgi:hypothetical protein
MRAVPVNREHIERAKTEQGYVVQVCITGQYRTPKGGGIAITGAFTEAKTKELLDFIRKWYLDTEVK